MILETVNGCICDSITIDGVETVDLPIDKVKNTIKLIIDKEPDLGVLQSILIDLIEGKGDYEDLGTCEDCGDFITKYTLKI